MTELACPIGLALALLFGYAQGPTPATDTRVAPAIEELRTVLPPEPRPTLEPAPSPQAPARVIRGIASTYGPGYAGLLDLPAGRGHRVRICGPAACVVRRSNDQGPAKRLRRVADLDVATFEKVCGCG